MPIPYILWSYRRSQTRVSGDNVALPVPEPVIHELVPHLRWPPMVVSLFLIIYNFYLIIYYLFYSYL